MAIAAHDGGVQQVGTTTRDEAGIGAMGGATGANCKWRDAGPSGEV